MEYNITSNPVKTAAHLEFSLDDDAVFHAMLFGTAVSAGLFEGRTDSHDIAFQMNKAVSMVNARLGEPRWVASDCVIRAVSCLAIGEVTALSTYRDRRLLDT